MKKFLILLTTVFLANFVFAQNKLSGNVADAATLKTLEAVTVHLTGPTISANKTTITNVDGTYHFNDVAVGVYTIQFSISGFKPKIITNVTLLVSDTLKTIETTYLSTLNKSLEAVTVTSKKAFIERKLDKTIINVEASLTSAGSTALEVLEKSPGVAVDKDGKISLKGKQGVIVLIDGKQTYMGAQDLANYLQSMPANNLDQIELMPNPSAKYDASGNSGVINIKLKRNKQKGFNGSVKNTLAAGKFLRSFNTLNLNYKNGKFNVFSTLGSNYRKIISS